MKPIERVRFIIEYSQLSIAAFEKKVGMSNNSIQIAIKRNANLKDESLISILRAFPEINPSWLLLGIEPKFIDNKSKSTSVILNGEINAYKTNVENSEINNRTDNNQIIKLQTENELLKQQNQSQREIIDNLISSRK